MLYKNLIQSLLVFANSDNNSGFVKKHYYSPGRKTCKTEGFHL